jgi:hypothetical protein
MMMMTPTSVPVCLNIAALADIVLHMIKQLFTQIYGQFGALFGLEIWS